MRAVFAEQADSALGIAERDQIFAQETHPNRRTVRRWNLLGQQRWDPISPHQLAHRRLRRLRGSANRFHFARAFSDLSNGF